MGTDTVRLFDKRLCDQIVAMDGEGLGDLVEARLPDFGEFSIFRFEFAAGVSGRDRVEALLRQGLSCEALKRELVRELCFAPDRMAVDYWGCFAEVFRAHPSGAISELELFPHITEEGFLLLPPDNVGRMVVSLRAHWTELEVMSESDVARLESWRELCARDSGWVVAYLFNA